MGSNKDNKKSVKIMGFEVNVDSYSNIVKEYVRVSESIPDDEIWVYHANGSVLKNKMDIILEQRYGDSGVVHLSTALGTCSFNDLAPDYQSI